MKNSTVHDRDVRVGDPGPLAADFLARGFDSFQPLIRAFGGLFASLYSFSHVCFLDFVAGIARAPFWLTTPRCFPILVLAALASWLFIYRFVLAIHFRVVRFFCGSSRSPYFCPYLFDYYPGRDFCCLLSQFQLLLTVFWSGSASLFFISQKSRKTRKTAQLAYYKTLATMEKHFDPAANCLLNSLYTNCLIVFWGALFHRPVKPGKDCRSPSAAAWWSHKSVISWRVGKTLLRYRLYRGIQRLF